MRAASCRYRASSYHLIAVDEINFIVQIDGRAAVSRYKQYFITDLLFFGIAVKLKMLFACYYEIYVSLGECGHTLINTAGLYAGIDYRETVSAAYYLC